jgi:hypothetical protein
MKKILILTITIVAFINVACDECGKTTYRPEIGVGYVFMYDADGNVLHPVAGTTVTVNSIYSTSGLAGKTWIVAEESFITDAEGRYQVRFVERGCYTNKYDNIEMVFCNTYRIYYNNKRFLGFTEKYIYDNVQYNILFLDTIKLKIE